MKKKGILFISLSACLLFFYLFPNHSSCGSQKEKGEIEQLLSGLSKQEKKDLKELFDHFFFFDEFAYTLFGTKPMSIGRLLPQAKNGWLAWKKISASMHSEKFIIREYIYNDKEFVLVANVDGIEKVYTENKALFDPFFENQTALIACLKQENSMFQQLMQNHLFAGILLGYGTNNAQKFAKNDFLQPFSKKVHPIFYYFSKVMPPCFACDPNTEETKELKKRYMEERAAIVAMAKKDSLFDRMLLLLF